MGQALMRAKGLLQCLIQSASACAAKGGPSTAPQGRDSSSSSAPLHHNQAVLLSVVESVVWCLVCPAVCGARRSSWGWQPSRCRLPGRPSPRSTTGMGLVWGLSAKMGELQTQSMLRWRNVCWAMRYQEQLAGNSKTRSRRHPDRQALARVVHRQQERRAAPKGRLRRGGPGRSWSNSWKHSWAASAPSLLLSREASASSAQGERRPNRPSCAAGVLQPRCHRLPGPPGAYRRSCGRGHRARGVSAALMRLLQCQRAASARACKATAAAAAAEAPGSREGHAWSYAQVTVL